MRSMISRKLFAGLTATGLLAAPLFAVAGPAASGNRPYLGMAAEATAKDGPNGVMVHSVSPDGPAAKAGLKSSDRILTADGKAVKTFEELKNTLAGHKPGDQIALKVMRDGKEQTITVTLADAPKNREGTETPAQQTGMFLGVLTQPLTAELRERLGVTVEKGAVVSQVVPGSPAAKAGLADGDVVTNVGDTAVNSPQELREAIRKAGAGQEVTVKAQRGNKSMDFKVRLQDVASGIAGFPQSVPGLPEGFDDFSGQLPKFFSGMEKVPALEKKLQELENRIRQLEQKPAK
jgi:S1-C subfamily serine protease